VTRSRVASRLLPGFPCILAVYLVLRYGPLLRRFAPQGNEGATGISDSFVLPLLVAAILAAAGLWIVRARSARPLVATLLRAKWAALLLPVLLFAAVFAGKATFGPYTDERRDAAILDVLAERDLGLYLSDTAEAEGLDHDQHYHLGGAQLQHPPGHYALGVLLSSAPRSIVAWRFLYALPIVLATLIAFGLARRRRTRLAVLAGVAFLASATYLRNYTFIRVGNELNPVLCMMGFLATLACVARNGGRWKPGTAALAAALFAAAMFSKFSALVSLFAVVGALGIVVLARRDRRSVLLLAGTVSVLAVTVVAYGILFHGTHMFEVQMEGYGPRFLRALRLVDTETAKEMAGGQGVGGRPMSYFFGRAPFQYGPVVLLLFGYSAWCVLARRVASRPTDLFVLTFIALNLLGVLLVNPRVQYTAPMMGAVAYFVVSVLARRFLPGDVARLAVIVALFAASEVSLML